MGKTGRDSTKAKVKSMKQEGIEVHKMLIEVKESAENLLQQVTKLISKADRLEKKVGNCASVFSGFGTIFSMHADMEKTTGSLREAGVNLKACLDRIGE